MKVQHVKFLRDFGWTPPEQRRTHLSYKKDWAGPVRRICAQAAIAAGAAVAVAAAVAGAAAVEEPSDADGASN